MPYLNLKAEMAKRNVSIEDISKLLDLHRNSVANKINGIIHDDCIVSNEKAEEILKRLGNTFHNYNLRKRERGD